MSEFARKLREEPAMVAAVVLAAVGLFGVRVSEEQASAISQIVVTFGPILAGLAVRHRVTPVAKLDNAEAYPEDAVTEVWEP